MQLSLEVLVGLKPPVVRPLEEAALCFGKQCGRLVNGRIGRMGEHIISQEPLHPCCRYPLPPRGCAGVAPWWLAAKPRPSAARPANSAPGRLRSTWRQGNALGASGRSPTKRLSMVKRPARARGRRLSLQLVWFGSAYRSVLGCAHRGLGGEVERRQGGV